MEMADRMRGGRWKVFKGQNDGWMQEVATYHRKDGLLIKEHDDAISASRYARMMRRLWPKCGGAAQVSIVKSGIQNRGYRMTPIYITIQLRRPSRDGEDPGAIEEAWFITEDDVVQFTNRDGHPLPGDENSRRLKEGQTARECAAQLLRSKARTRTSRPFNRPIRYPKAGFI